MTQMTIQQAIELARQYQQAGRFQEAEAIDRQVLAQMPNHPEALHLLGLIAGQCGHPDEAAALIRRAIAAAPHNPIYHCNLGSFLQNQGLHEQAIASYQRALAINPGDAVVHNNLGVALTYAGQLDQGNLDRGIASYRRALEINPDFSEAHNNLGNALVKKGRLDDAIAHYQRALALKPNYCEAYGNLGSAWKDKGQLDDALACCRKALQLNPRYIGAHDNLLLVAHYHPEFDAPRLFAESQKWNEQHAEPLRQFIQPHRNDRDPQRRLRIGYVSTDFFQHASAFFLLPLFCHHDREQFEVTCYAESAYSDATTRQMRDHVQRWRITAGQSDAQAAAMIRQDKIDILVDLKLHTSNNRLLIFAYKPAPVQVTWLGYPGTTGLKTIDYRLTDPYLDPPGLDDAFYSEQSILLPESFWCYDPLDTEPAVSALPAGCNGHITFGCLNNFCKINDVVLSLWARILRASAGSHLLLLVAQGSSRQRVLDQLAAEGIAAERVEFVPIQPRLQYLRTYHCIDIGLDTWPCNGHTTSLDSLWMGIPVITMVGRTSVGRAGVSQLSNLGQPRWIAHTPQEYEQIAGELAADLPRLGEHRATLRQRMQISPLMDGARFARNMESVYRQIWRTWCAK